MNHPKSKQELFIFGLSLTAGEGRLNDGTNNKIISTDESGMTFPGGTNLYIEGQEVRINSQTLADNGLYEEWFEMSEDQKMYLLAGMIAGMFQPSQIKKKWAFLTFIVDEEEELEDTGDFELYIRSPLDNGPDYYEMNDEDDDSDDYDPIPSPDPGDIIGGLFPPPDPVPKPTPGDKYRLYPDNEYIIYSEDGVKVPLNARLIEASETYIVQDTMEKTVTDYTDPDTGNKMTEILIPVGNNWIRITFLESDKREDGQWYRVGASITIEGVPTTGWTFIRWTINNSYTIDDNPYTFTAEEDTVFAGKFCKIGKKPMEGLHELIKYMVSGSVNDPNLGTISGLGEYFEDKEVTLTAILYQDASVDNWTVDGQIVSTSNTYTFTINSNVSVVLNLSGGQIVYYVVTGTTDGNGSIDGLGSYQSGETVTLTGVPNFRYKVHKWYVDGSEVSNNETYVFTISDDVDVYLTFIDIIPYVTNGIVDCFDTYLNTGSDYKNSIKVWKNVNMDQPSISVNSYGYCDTDIEGCFDALDYGSISGKWENKA